MYCGFDIGGTKCAVTLGEIEKGEVKILYKDSFKTEGNPYFVIDKMIALLEEGKRKLNAEVVKIGISCGGPLDDKRGIIQSPPNLPKWDNIEICKYIKEKTGIDSVLKNDADACAIAEWKFGAGKGCENMVFLTFGTGLGAGLILNGKPYSGTNGNAGEVGHFRLEKSGPIGYNKKGSFEGFCSGGGIKQLAESYIRKKLKNGEKVDFIKSEKDIENVSAKTLFIEAEKGDKTAKLIFKKVGEQFGKGLALIVDILNPQIIVAGGVYMRAYKYIYPYAMKVLEKESLSQSLSVVKLLPSALGESIGDYAAISLAYSI